MPYDIKPELPEPEVTLYPLWVRVIVWSAGLCFSAAGYAVIFYFVFKVPMKITLTTYALLVFLLLALIEEALRPAKTNKPQPRFQIKLPLIIRRLLPWDAR